MNKASWELELSGSCVALNFYRQEGEMWFMGTSNLGLYTQWKPTVNICFIPAKGASLTVNAGDFEGQEVQGK